uniref:Elongation of very long chain fatty acids protein n=1 Tax=Tigriopus californicus TaxID=6832 RepID=A0A8E8HB09_TIGCA|nr:fatty acid elongase 3 [Tigriopus californicus]
MSVVDLTRTYIHDLWELRDKRMDGYPLMSSPWPAIGLCFGYICIVKLIGPAIMKNREPFQLKTPMLLYNGFQVVFSLFVVCLGVQAGWFNGYSLRCQPVDYSNEPKPVLMAFSTYLYFCMKFVEFLDTIFFILRKKDSQVSFLHVAHHAIMAVYMWPIVRFMPGGHGSLAGLLNSFVHIIMYGYYFMAALGPRFKRFLWWKRYLTWLQMVQFFVIAIHSVQLLVVEDCGYPWEYAYVVLALMVFFLTQFANFYVQSYLSTPRVNGSATMIKED